MIWRYDIKEFDIEKNGKNKRETYQMQHTKTNLVQINSIYGNTVVDLM